MLVVISDLHFEEEEANAIPGDGTHPAVRFSRNLPAKVYRSFIVQLANEARRNNARQLDLVFAGDIFDIIRTALWFSHNPTLLRPYVSSREMDDALEKMVLKIFEAIGRAGQVSKTLEAFRLLAGGHYWDGEEKPFPVPVHFHYIPGNHDRLLNGTPAVRRAVRQALGMPDGGAPFPRIKTFAEEGAVVRHGHEYDRYNFAWDYTDQDEIPLHLPDDHYDDAPFGDYAAVEIASGFPYMFRQFHNDGQILADPVLRSVYLRLLEFDDLRPQRALLNFLLHTPEAHLDPVRVWRTIEPVIYEMLEQRHEDDFLHDWLDRMDKKWQLDAIDAIQTVLATHPWRLAGIPLGLARFISNTLLGEERVEPGAAIYAAREAVIRNGQFRFVIAGHTHKPALELLGSDPTGERYYIDTGTWRNRVPATPDYDGFGRLKTLTYVTVYGPNEDLGHPPQPGKLASVDFWSGLTQRWAA